VIRYLILIDKYPFLFYRFIELLQVGDLRQVETFLWTENISYKSHILSREKDMTLTKMTAIASMYTNLPAGS
jgi:hypothetical protein